MDCFVMAVSISGGVEISRYEWPSLARTFCMRTSTPMMDIVALSKGSFLGAAMITPESIVELDAFNRLGRRLGAVRGQYLRHAIRVGGNLFFVSAREKRRVLGAPGLSELVPMEARGSVSEIVRCGSGFMTVEIDSAGVSLVRRDASGNAVSRVTDGPSESAPACSADGRVWYYARAGDQPGILRCHASQCDQVFRGVVWRLALSPSGNRLLVLNSANHGFRVHVISSAGGDPREVSDSETACSPGWSSERSAWISRRRGRGFAWVEVDVDTRRETGREQPASKNCSEGRDDPTSPVAELRLVSEFTSQVRVLDLPRKAGDSPL
jgi:hypothetical protein